MGLQGCLHIGFNDCGRGVACRDHVEIWYSILKMTRELLAADALSLT
jgi:hypothetical protein